MRKMLGLVIILGLLLSSVAYGWQDSYDYTIRLNFSTYISDNTTGAYQVTYVSKTTIVPGTAHIIGYSIMPTATASENVVALHDSEITDVYLDESLIDESECPANSFAGKWFPCPKSLKTQLCIRQGAKTRVFVYYTTY